MKRYELTIEEGKATIKVNGEATPQEIEEISNYLRNELNIEIFQKLNKLMNEQIELMMKGTGEETPKGIC